ncbi:hypothetical protein [Rivularia sp. UHCC 0363]|uniref:hypothetical protein n=1 Tax=Rivularia sp. UHCC 0363 TaxID=3110244 RepID=UPI002B1F2B3E|nr:hypothetical protein [Rivularia sp. UHCC 0363]MEA5593470.1 hypothetical protein [Rivularia sp. UHCC 0363]
MSKTIDKGSLCYTTLAIGYEYNKYAQLLAKDIFKLSPDVPIVILSDRPHIFFEYPNVIAVKHNIQSVGIFHDKLCCIEKCLENYDCCIFMDADCRLIENMAISRNWKPGLTAKTHWSLTKHITPNVLAGKKELKRRLAYEVAKELEIIIDNCNFIYEAIFIIRKDNGKEVEFLKIWKQIRDYFESNGIFDGEGVAMGLAAHKASLEIYHYNSGYAQEEVDYNIKDVYKDKLFYKLLIHNDTDNLSDVLCEKVLKLDEQRKQMSKLPFWRKLIKKISNPILKKLRFVRLKNKNFNKSNFSHFV